MRRKYKMMTKRDAFESVTSWDLPPICDKCLQVYEMSGFACCARLGQQNAQSVQPSLWPTFLFMYDKAEIQSTIL